MKRNTPPPTPDTPKKSIAKSARNVSPDDIVGTSMWRLEQLNRIQKPLVEHGADDEMLEAVEYLIEENDCWGSPEVEARMASPRTGKA
jgi:hypothetical protein